MLQSEKDKLLNLPYGVTGWILLRNAALSTHDLDLYKKLFQTYGSDIPMSEIQTILKYARWSLTDEEFHSVLEALFGYERK